jgi:hypothetical protein
LPKKLIFTSKRTTREKLLSYFSAEARKAKSSRFTIPFNRQELADFLSVDRSAMSAELGKLRDEGALKFHKNEFELLRVKKALPYAGKTCLRTLFPFKNRRRLFYRTRRLFCLVPKKADQLWEHPEIKI